MNIRDFTELLKGCRPIKDSDGNIIVQSILNMQLVCLTTNDEFSMDERFANPLTALEASNRTYGQINFRNKENKEVIVPTQTAIMTKQSAQNHGMVKSGYISSNASTTFHDAGCVQGSQTGHFRGSNEFRMIPVTMREMLFDKVGQTSGHSNIYPAIEKLGRETQSSTGTYLDKYFNKYDKKLEQFIAHFERPDKLIGIIVLIDDEVVAVDKFPSFTYAEQVWKLMIRDCYGSLAIMSELKNRTSNNTFTEKYNEIRKKRAHQENVVNLIEEALKKTKESITESVQSKIQDLLDISFDATLDTEGNSSGTYTPKSYILKSDGYIGQVIAETEFNHMVSIVKKESFDPSAYRVVNEMRNKARRQERFSI